MGRTFLWISSLIAFCACATSGDAGRRSLLSALEIVELGMPRDLVDQAMVSFMRGSAWRIPKDSKPPRTFRTAGGEREYAASLDASGYLVLPGCEIFRHSDEPDFDADWAIVCFQAGRVISKEFALD